MTERAHVPCNGCTLCCRLDLIVLHPERGDDPARYLTEPMEHPMTGKTVHVLKHGPDGWCIYLGQNGCTIHDRAPAICREFDCGQAWAMVPRAERRRRVKAGLADAAIYAQGRHVQQLRGQA